MTKLDFIHIGLGKCMSTRLQGHWEQDASYNSLNGQGVSGALDQIVKQGISGTDNIKAALAGLNLNFPAFKTGVTNLLTSEALTFSYLHSPELGEAIKTKDEAASLLLAGMTDKVLMLVRDPVDWIKSCYAQQIKEGGCVPLATYLQTHRAVILNNLNLDRRIEAWSRFGADVVILPTELASRSDAEFWSAYEERLGVTRPSNWRQNNDFVTTNVTRYSTLEPHRRTNELLQLLERSLRSADLPQKQETLKMMDTARRFGVRWGFGAADAQTQNEIISLLGMGTEDCEFGEFSLDDECLAAIEDTFISPLRNDPCFEQYGCLEAYTESLDAQSSAQSQPMALSGAAAG